VGSCDLCSALDQFCRCGHDEGCQATGGTGQPDLGEGLGRSGRSRKGVEQGEAAVVGGEEEGVEGAVGEDGGSCSCVGSVSTGDADDWVGWRLLTTE